MHEIEKILGRMAATVKGNWLPFYGKYRLTTQFFEMELNHQKILIIEQILHSISQLF